MTASQEKPSTQGTPKRGRPRDPEADRAIIRATLKLLTERGYAGMSVEQVASEAKVGKTTIYRRYNSKEELAAAAVSTLKADRGAPCDTGSVRTDMVEMIIQNQTMLERGPGFAIIGALLVEERRNPALFEIFRERIIRPRRDDAINVLQRGVERGQIRADADLGLAVEAIIGSIIARHILGTRESRDEIERTVDTIWNGLANRP